MASTGSVAEGGQDGLGARRNWLRAGVLGVNDGLVLTAGLVIGVAGATNSTKALLTAGLAGLRAGSLSLAAGEYVSVSSHRDSERIQARMTHPGQIATIDIDNTSPRIWAGLPGSKRVRQVVVPPCEYVTAFPRAPRLAESQRPDRVARLAPA